MKLCFLFAFQENYHISIQLIVTLITGKLLGIPKIHSSIELNCGYFLGKQTETSYKSLGYQYKLVSYKKSSENSREYPDQLFSESEV